jgi:hypothetical protein
MDLWRAPSLTAEAYVSEADALEPDWLQSFWGANYEKLLGIKRDRNLWGVIMGVDDIWV